MLKSLFGALSTMTLEYHELQEWNADAIRLAATSLNPEGIEEVMRIKNLADAYGLHAVWDGENIEIIRLHPS